jgi:colicin import membrane protein
MEDRAKAELKSREEQNKRRLAEQLARQKAAYQLQKQLVEENQRAEQLLQQAKIEEKNRLAREAKRKAEKERERLKAIQERKEKLAKEQRQMEAARKENEAKEQKRREIFAKKMRAASYRSELRIQRQTLSDALSKWTVRAYTFTFEQQTPEFINWCDRCFHLIRFGGYYRMC